MRGLALLPIAVTFALGLASCAHPQARTEPARVPLDVPLPPERIIAAPPPEEPPEIVAQPPEAPSPKPVRPRAPAPRTEPAPAAAPPAAPPPAPAAGALQTSPPASQAETVKTIRDLIARANRDLAGIARGSLSADGRAQYDTAARFAAQAEQALREMNLAFALTLADKAATLARSLAGRD